MNPHLSLAVSIVIGVLGQLLLKAGSARPTWAAYIPLNAFTILGLGSYFVSALFYIVAIRRIPISFAFPSVSISYVAVAYLAHRLHGEPFGWGHIAALALITSGIVVLARVSGGVA